MSRGPTRPTWRSLIPACVLATLAVGAFFSPDLIYPTRAAQVNVRWGPSVDAPARSRFEDEYQLTRGRVHEGRTWAYYVRAPSSDTLRALVTNPAVEDTHFIHRTQFRVWRTAPREPYVGPGADVVPGISRRVAAILGFLAVGAALVAVFPAQAAGVAARTAAVSSRTANWASGVVPSGTAVSVAGYRIVFGSFLLALAVARPINASLAEAVTASTDPWTLFGPLWHAFENRPWLADAIQVTLVVSLMLFIVGAASRLSYAVACGGLLVWVLLNASRSGGHPYSAFLASLLCLLASPWGDAWSVDARIRRARGSLPIRRTPVEYGYTTWVPGVVIGVCFLAAAFAKLREGGLGWITNGTVKYHFLSDSPRALVEWGASLGQFPRLAVAVSAMAILIESAVVIGALSHRYWMRALAGMASAAILVGFLVFQGLFWPGWWLLLLSFLPWHLLGDRPAQVPPTGSVSRMRRAQVAVLVVLVAQQVVVSTVRAEVFPLLSYYDMYSSTNSSPAEYEQDSGMSYYLVAQADTGPPRECEVPRPVAEAWMDPQRGARDRAALRAARNCFGDGTAAPLVVEGRRMKVDWVRWRFDGQTRSVLAGPLGWAPSTSP